MTRAAKMTYIIVQNPTTKSANTTTTTTEKTKTKQQKSHQTTTQEQQKIQDLMTFLWMRRATPTEDVWCNRRLGYMVPSEQRLTDESNQIVHDIRCHAMRVKGVSNSLVYPQVTKRVVDKKLQMGGEPKPTTN